MAILRVAQMGHPVLRMVAEPVDPTLIPSAEFQAFCDDLLETMEDYDGAGLAAPQVHVPLRVCVLTLHDQAEFFINPVITVLSDAVRRSWEGCLSVEGLRGYVERPAHIRISALGRDGQRKAYELRGFPATVTQHECDHLDGVLYTDKVLPRSLVFRSELNKWGGPEEYLDEDELDEDLDLDEEE